MVYEDDNGSLQWMEEDYLEVPFADSPRFASETFGDNIDTYYTKDGGIAE